MMLKEDVNNVGLRRPSAMLESPLLLDFKPRLPPRALRLFDNDQAWRVNFRDCYFRIAMRVQKGLPPLPNCRGEEMALHNIMDHARDHDDLIRDELNQLPEHRDDDDFAGVMEWAVEDDDVLSLFDNESQGPNDPSLADVALGYAAHLHPEDWFYAISEERMRDHLSGMSAPL